VAAWVAPLHHAVDAACVLAERAVSRALAGSCEVPLGAYAINENGELWLRGFVSTPDGTRMARAELRGPAAEAEALGKRLADELLQQGAKAILSELGSLIPANLPPR
jgi:hydroxymethylbilane synthase